MNFAINRDSFSIYFFTQKVNVKSDKKSRWNTAACQLYLRYLDIPVTQCTRDGNSEHPMAVKQSK
jgi:hypothetical protein